MSPLPYDLTFPRAFRSLLTEASTFIWRPPGLPLGNRYWGTPNIYSPCPVLPVTASWFARKVEVEAGAFQPICWEFLSLLLVGLPVHPSVQVPAAHFDTASLFYPDAHQVDTSGPANFTVAAAAGLSEE